MELAVNELGRVVADDSKDKKKTITTDRFSVGALSGFDMAMQDMIASGFAGFELRDVVVIKCVSVQESTKRGFSDMPLFEIEINPNKVSATSAA